MKTSSIAESSPASLAGRLARFGRGERAGEELGEPGERCPGDVVAVERLDET